MDAKAKKILIQTFWSGGGWRVGGPSCSNEDFEYAKSKGLMFDPANRSHDECISTLRELHAQPNLKDKAVRAFLHSLSTRKVHLRSALSSYALTCELLVHTYAERPAEQIGYCACGDCNDKKLMANDQYVNEDLNVLNFERIKWGGVRLNWLIYCLMDLELLNKEDWLEVRSEDIAILQQMIQDIEACSDTDAARQLEKRWKDVFPSNQHERDRVLEIWGFAGLLQSTNDYRKERGRGSDFVSMCTWRGEDGYCKEKLDLYFGPYL
ncbi:hypothetical protein [Paenibacillus aquistagni]|uniref:hypothetical protein n=1 Tax=Paenibacillus aquistagni TaxID=1852522 RepID=UPI00145A7575|nr:hypothetical protein [Paenibacillus aquistagni]NMM52696.1 hypothetical protein [Paenibacillus aquistagni]